MIKSIDFYTRNIINSRQALDYVRAKFPEIEFNVYQIQNMPDFGKVVLGSFSIFL